MAREHEAVKRLSRMQGRLQDSDLTVGWTRTMTKVHSEAPLFSSVSVVAGALDGV